MTSKKQLEKYLLALGALSTSMMQEIARTVAEKEQEIEDEEDIKTLVALMFASAPGLRRRFQKQVNDFLKEWNVSEIINKCADDIGHPINSNSKTVETIEKGLKAMPAGATRRMNEMVNEISNRTGLKREAVETALEHFAGKNIPAIQYEDGKAVSVESYAKTAINTDLHTAQLEKEAEEREKNGIHLVYAAPRREACPKCIPWLGVIMYDDFYSTGPVPDDNAYPLLSEAVKNGFLHPNCRDTIRTVTPAVEDSIRPMTEREQKEAEERYKKEQYINYLKRNIKRYKILESAYPEKYTQMRKRWEERLKEAGQ